MFCIYVPFNLSLCGVTLSKSIVKSGVDVHDVVLRLGPLSLFTLKSFCPLSTLKCDETFLKSVDSFVALN